MTGTGPLTVDGHEVDVRWLTRVVNWVARELSGCGRVTAGPDPVATVVATLAAEQAGVPIVLLPRAGSAPQQTGADAVVHISDREPIVQPLTPAPDGVALPEGTAAVFGTSGSSGDPKLVALSRSALDYQAHATRERLDIGPGDGLGVPLPLHHAYGFSLIQVWKLAGPRLVIESAFRPDRLTALLGDDRVTSLDGVPSMYASLLGQAANQPGLTAQLARLRIRGCGGDVLPASLQQRFLDATGEPVHDGYGLTEAGPNVAISGPGTWRSGTVGPPLAGTEVALSARGELLVRGPGVMLGYVGDPVGTAQTLPSNGWLRTGDIAEIGADGYLTIHGRVKEVLVIHGETFAPTEIEAVLSGCADIVEAGVVGLRSDQLRGDRILAFVVSRQGRPAAQTAAALRREIRDQLPPVLRPHHIRVIDALPRLASGKLDRQELRRLAVAR